MLFEDKLAPDTTVYKLLNGSYSGRKCIIVKGFEHSKSLVQVRLLSDDDNRQPAGSIICNKEKDLEELTAG